MLVFGDLLLLSQKRDRIVARLFWKGLLLDLVLVLDGEWGRGFIFCFRPFSFWTLRKVSFVLLEWKKAEVGWEKSGSGTNGMNYQQ